MARVDNKQKPKSRSRQPLIARMLSIAYLEDAFGLRTIATNASQRVPEAKRLAALGDTMTNGTHKNVALLAQLNLKNLDASEGMFADDFVWHYFNQRMPEIEGVYRGVEGLKDFFAKLGRTSRGSFQVNPVDIRTAGDELVVTQVRNCMTLDASSIEFDAVVVWRIISGKIAEAWDIPAVNTIRIMNKS